MLTFLTAVHIFVSISLVILVLIQDSKGDAMGALGGGGGSNSFFGATGATTFLAKATRYMAIVFAATSIGLALQTTTKNSSVTDDFVAPAQFEAPVDKEKSASPTKTEPKDESTKDQGK